MFCKRPASIIITNNLLKKTSSSLKRNNKNNTRCSSSNGATEIRSFSEIPEPKGLPIVGTTLSLIAAGSAPKLHEYVDKRHKQLGSIYKEKIGPVRAVFISDPEYMRVIFAHEGKHPVHVLPEAWTVYNQLYGCSRGLFFMNGDEWLHYRRILNKYLLKGGLDLIEDACEVVTDLMIERFKRITNHDAGGIYPNLELELYTWSIHIVIATLLGARIYQQAYEKMRLLIEMLARKVHVIFLTTSRLSLIPAALAAKFNIKRWRDFVKSVDEALQDARNLTEILLDNYPKGDGLLMKLKEEQVGRGDVIRIVTDLILAAGDTTAYSMEWMLYCIAKNPNVQEQLRHRSSDNVLLKNVLKETLRLYPVAPFLTRILPEECIVGGYRIPAKTLTVLSIYTSGRDARYFTNPEEFRPDRWVRTESTTVNRSVMQHASLPFAMGARSCVGRKIAENQLQMTLAKIVDNFNVVLCNERTIDVVLKMVVVPSEPLKLRFCTRSG